MPFLVQYSEKNAQRDIDHFARQHEAPILLVDSAGRVLIRSSNSTMTQVNLHRLQQESLNLQRRLLLGEWPHSQRIPYIFPLTYQGKAAYLVVWWKGIEHTVTYQTGDQWGGIIGFISFFIFFTLLTNRKMKKIEEMAHAVEKIGGGNLNTRIPETGEDELGALAQHINRLSQEIKDLIEREKQAEKMKVDLITHVSHDLRTPLTTLVGYLKLLKDRDLPLHERNRYLNVAYKKALSLTRLIEDLFEYTKLAHHDVKLDFTRLSMNRFLQQFVEEMIPLAEEHGLQVKTRFTPHPLLVRMDSNKMVRLFENLWSNAMKYSKKPGTLRFETEQVGNEAVILFANPSEPLSAEMLSQLFERFTKRDQARSKTEEGSGLGLAIAKSIIELHQGTIEARMEKEELQFRIRLPLAE